MTDMYDEPKKFDGNINPYPHSEKGVEVRKEDRSCSAAAAARGGVSFCVCVY